MKLKRTDFLKLSALSAAAFIPGVSAYANKNNTTNTAGKLKTLTDDVKPITVEERKIRIAKAQRLMTEQKMAALVLDSGTSLKYFGIIG